MPGKDDRIAEPLGRVRWREEVTVLVPFLMVVAALVMLPLGFILGSSVIGECRDPGGCTETPVFTLSEGGVPNSAGFLLIAGSVLLIAGIVLFIRSELKRKRGVR